MYLFSALFILSFFPNLAWKPPGHLCTCIVIYFQIKDQLTSGNILHPFLFLAFQRYSEAFSVFLLYFFRIIFCENSYFATKHRKRLARSLPHHFKIVLHRSQQQTHTLIIHYHHQLDSYHGCSSDDATALG